jgi:hypothetical protein
MIKYDLTNINKWYNGSRNIVKCYHGTTNAFDLTGGGAPTPPPTGQTPCYAVTNNISQYQSTEFVDVYDTTADKWYKLNNLNEYEEYGIYGSGRTNTTYYEGKLTIDDGYEYIYSGNSWVNLGEVSGSSKTSDFTIDDIGNKVNTNVGDGDYVVISYYNHDNPREPQYMMSYKYQNAHNYANNFSGNTGSNTITTGTVIDNAVWILEATSTADTYYIKNVTTNEYWGYQRKAPSQSFYTVNSSSKSPIRLVAYNNGVGFVEKASGANTFYGGYGLNQLYSYTYQLNWWNDAVSSAINFFGSDGNALYTIYEVDNGGGSTYPEYYDEIADPPTSVTFTTMADALAYQCPYVGLRATIAGDNYIFNSNYEWEEIQVFKMVAQYTQDRSYTAACDGDSELTTGITQGGYEFGEMTSAEIGECVDNVTYGAFSGFTSLTSLTIPNSVTTFGARCISECTSLTSLTLSENTEVIYGYAFYGCSVLQYILINKATPPNLPYNTAFNNTNNCPIYVPSASVNAYKSANNWSTYASRIQAIPT